MAGLRGLARCGAGPRTRGWPCGRGARTRRRDLRDAACTTSRARARVRRVVRRLGRACCYQSASRTVHQTSPPSTSSSGNQPATVPATITISIPRSLRGPSSLRHRRAVFTCVASVVVVPTHHSASSMECPVCLMLPEGEVHQCNEVWPLPQEPCSPQPSNPNP